MQYIYLQVFFDKQQIMRRERNIYYSNKPQRKIYVDYSPKINAKNHEGNMHKKTGKEQVSAYMHRRNPQINTKLPETSPHSKQKQILKSNQEFRHILSEDQIRNSTLYRMLEQQILELTKQQNLELAKLREAKQQKKSELTTLNKEQYSVKLQIWELRNQISDIKDSIEQEKRQTERLNEELGIVQGSESAQQLEEGAAENISEDVASELSSS